MKQFRTRYCRLRGYLRGRLGPGFSCYDRSPGGGAGTTGLNVCLAVVQAETELGTS